MIQFSQIVQKDAMAIKLNYNQIKSNPMLVHVSFAACKCLSTDQTVSEHNQIPIIYHHMDIIYHHISFHNSPVFNLITLVWMFLFVKICENITGHGLNTFLLLHSCCNILFIVHQTNHTYTMQIEQTYSSLFYQNGIIDVVKQCTQIWANFTEKGQ